MSRRSAQAHPLLRAFPLAVMALATLLALFALMMAGLKADPSDAHASRPATPIARVQTELGF